MSKLYAQPYSISATGFYFSSPEGFAQKAGRNIDPGTGAPIEEYSIEFIDGSKADAELFNLLSKHGSVDIETWYDDIEPLEKHEKAALAYLVGNLGYSQEDAMDMIEEVSLFEGTPEEYAHELLDDIGIGSKSLEMYFDFKDFGRDRSFDLDADDDDDAYYLSLDDAELGEEYVDSMGGVGALDKATAERYFDYAAFARDSLLNSDIAEMSFAGTDYVVTNANGI